MTPSVIEVYSFAGELLKSMNVENYQAIDIWQGMVVLGTSEGETVLIDAGEWKFLDRFSSPSGSYPVHAIQTNGYGQAYVQLSEYRYYLLELDSGKIVLQNSEPKAKPVCQKWLKSRSSQRVLYQLEQNSLTGELYMVVTSFNSYKWFSQRFTLRSQLK